MTTNNRETSIKQSRIDTTDMGEFFKKIISPTVVGVNVENTEELLDEIQQLQSDKEKLSVENEALKKENQILKEENDRLKNNIIPEPTPEVSPLQTHSNLLGLSVEKLKKCKDKRITLTCRRITEAKFPKVSDRLTSRLAALTKEETYAIREAAKILHPEAATLSDRLLTNPIDSVFSSQKNQAKKKKKLEKKKHQTIKKK